jgi:hypothetical protein
MLLANAQVIATNADYVIAQPLILPCCALMGDLMSAGI